VDKNSLEELLRKQLQLLAERSKDCQDDMLPAISLAMIEIYKLLKPSCSVSEIANQVSKLLAESIEQQVHAGDIHKLPTSQP